MATVHRYLNDAQRAGRDTWYFWTGGNEKFWVKMAELTEGNVNLLAYVDSRLHGRRFATLGAITQPGCRPATGPDEYGLWMDQLRAAARCRASRARQRASSGCGGFRNPKFDKANWNAEEYFKNPGKTEPPYLIGMACGFCHVGFNPLNPPRESRGAEMVEPRRRDRQPVLGRRPAVQPADAVDRLPLARRQPAARPARRTRRALRPTTSTIRTRSTPIFNLAYRPTADGADGRRDDASGASHPQGRRRFDRRRGRVAARLRQHRHVLGLLADAARSGERPQAAEAVRASRTRARTARTGATPKRGWRTPRRFSRPCSPMHLRGRARTAPAYQTADADDAAPRQDRVCRQVRALPLEQAAAGRDRDRSGQGRRVVSRVGAEPTTSSTRTSSPTIAATRCISSARTSRAPRRPTRWPGRCGREFSSETYKQQPAIGKICGPLQPARSRRAARVGAPGRRPRLLPHADAHLDVGDGAVSAQQRARACTSRIRRCAAGMLSFYDSTEKLLWPERRLGVQSIIVTSIDTELRIPDRDQAAQDPGRNTRRPHRARRPARGAARSPRTASCSTCSRTRRSSAG